MRPKSGDRQREDQSYETRGPRDHGIGMEEQDIKKALKPYGMVNNDGNEGTGLGLPLVVKLMELHGGKMIVTSKIDAGTEVCLTFPAERTVTL